MLTDSPTGNQLKPVFRGTLIAILVLVVLGGALALTLFWSGDPGTGNTGNSPSTTSDWNAILHAESSHQYERAIDICLDLAERKPDQASDALAYAGEIAIWKLGQLSRGEGFLRRAMRANPESRKPLSDYVRTLTITGQRWKSLPYLSRFVVRFDSSLPELLWLSDEKR